MKCGLVAMAWWLQTAGAAMAAVESTIYDPDPRHLWNQLNQTLFERTAPDGKQFGFGRTGYPFLAYHGSFACRAVQGKDAGSAGRVHQHERRRTAA